MANGGGRTDGRTDGRKDGRTEGQLDKVRESLCPNPMSNDYVKRRNRITKSNDEVLLSRTIIQTDEFGNKMSKKSYFSKKLDILLDIFVVDISELDKKSWTFSSSP